MKSLFTNHRTAIMWAFFVLYNLLEKVLSGHYKPWGALFVTSQNKFKVQIAPFVSARAFSPTIQHMASPPWKNTLTMNTRPLLPSMLCIIEWKEVSDPGHEKRKKRKWATPFAMFVEKQVCLQENWNPCENQVCFKSYTFPKDIRACMCHHNLLQLSIFTFTCLCFVWSNLGYYKGSD